MAKIQIKSEKLTPFFLVIIYWSLASFAPYAVEGAEALSPYLNHLRNLSYLNLYAKL